MFIKNTNLNQHLSEDEKNFLKVRNLKKHVEDLEKKLEEKTELIKKQREIIHNYESTPERALVVKQQEDELAEKIRLVEARKERWRTEKDSLTKKYQKSKEEVMRLHRVINGRELLQPKG